MDFTVVSPEVAAATRARDEAVESSFQKTDFAAIREAQLRNLALRGTAGYDATCRVEDSCMPPPRDVGEAVTRMFDYMQDAELGISQDRKLRAMGLDPRERVNSKMNTNGRGD